MNLETVRMIADALDGAYGVNVKIPLVTRDAGDPAPPNVQAVLDSTRHARFARDQGPNDWPVLMIRPQQSEIEPSSAQATRDGLEVPLQIDYIAKSAHLPATARDAGYTLRAVLKTLDELIDGTHPADVVRNGVGLLRYARMTGGEPFEIRETKAPQVVLRLTLVAHVRDTTP